MTDCLVVDDEADCRYVLLSFLRERGLSAEGVEDGKTALTLVPRLKPRVIFLDIEMPGMNGIETLKRLREAIPACRVIMISGISDLQRAEEALGLGAFDYLQKPIDFSYLKHLLETSWAISP